ncbi:hypothetical protein FOZ61_010857 [Perkinsus olseni]|uniref:Uncharacterized protein n=1 Tax=Perkinsus olseni TaxID=32597 RepID=A0A7J6KWQ9_PEROL|nr:hypothetical protein FOZ61_010857 [Perkinsus olseni]KAF4652270.1 hypothetical protein FOL46_009816 [Perkinsus olseni]
MSLIVLPILVALLFGFSVAVLRDQYLWDGPMSVILTVYRNRASVSLAYSCFNSTGRTFQVGRFELNRVISNEYQVVFGTVAAYLFLIDEIRRNCPVSPLIYGDLPVITFSDNLPTVRVGGKDATFERVPDGFYEPFHYKRGTAEIDLSYMLVPPIQVEVTCTVPTSPTLSPGRIRKSVFQTVDGSLKRNGVSKIFTAGPDSLERLHSEVEESCNLKMASDDFKHVVANSDNAATVFGGSVIYLTAVYA